MQILKFSFAEIDLSTVWKTKGILSALVGRLVLTESHAGGSPIFNALGQNGPIQVMMNMTNMINWLVERNHTKIDLLFICQ